MPDNGTKIDISTRLLDVAKHMERFREDELKPLQAYCDRAIMLAADFARKRHIEKKAPIKHPTPPTIRVWVPGSSEILKVPIIEPPSSQHVLALQPDIDVETLRREMDLILEARVQLPPPSGPFGLLPICNVPDMTDIVTALEFDHDRLGQARELERRIAAVREADIAFVRAMHGKTTLQDMNAKITVFYFAIDDAATYCGNLARMLEGNPNQRADGGRLRQAIGLPDPPVAVLHPDDDPASGAVVVLHPDDLKILQALAKAKTTQGQYVLEQTTGLSRRTISDRLRGLRDAGFTSRPKGERGGEAITNKGRAALPQDEQAAH